MKAYSKFLILGICLALLGPQIWLFRNSAADDAFITFRCVQQWVNGNGLVYNLGERVEGYSNFLWIVLLAPFARFNLDLLTVARVLGVLLSFLTLLITWHYSLGISRWQVAPLFLAVSAPFVGWSVGGLETPLFTFLLTAGGLTFLREEESGKGVFSGIFFALLALARPEGLLFGLIAIAYRGLTLYLSEERLSKRDYFRLALLAGIFLPYFVWRFAYYGHPIPNTVYAKSMGFHLRPLLEGVYYFYQAFQAVGGFFFIGLPFLLALSLRPLPKFVSYLGLNVVIYAGFVTAGGGDWMPMQRFAVHILPFTFLLVQAGLEKLIKIWTERWAKALVLILVVGQIGYLLTGSLEKRFLERVGKHPFYETLIPLLTYMQERVRPGDTIALFDAGYLAYKLPLNIKCVDMVGLVDAHIAHLPVKLPGGILSQGNAFGKWDVDYILAQKPRFVQMGLSAPPKNNTWQTPFTGTTLLANDPRFQKEYRPVIFKSDKVLFELITP